MNLDGLKINISQHDTRKRFLHRLGGSTIFSARQPNTRQEAGHHCIYEGEGRAREQYKGYLATAVILAVLRLQTSRRAVDTGQGFISFAVRGTLLALQLCVDALVLLRAQHLPRTRTCRAAHTQPLASCGAPLRSERAPFGAHGGRADATSSLSRYSSGCPWLIFQRSVSRSQKRDTRTSFSHCVQVPQVEVLYLCFYSKLIQGAIEGGRFHPKVCKCYINHITA